MEPYETEVVHAVDFYDAEATAVVVEAICGCGSKPVGGDGGGRSQVWCGGVPAISAVFVGREVLLERLTGSTADGGAAVLTQSVQGMVGVGNTTVAAALTEAQRQLGV